MPPVPPPDRSAPDPVAARRRRDATAALSCVLLVGLAAPLARGWSRIGSAASPGAPSAPVVDLAQDPPWRLALLPGIGMRRATEIAAGRRTRAITTVDDLARVPGIGRATVEGIATTRALRVRIAGRPVGCRDERRP
jgi:hypothetical protein